LLTKSREDDSQPRFIAMSSLACHQSAHCLGYWTSMQGAMRIANEQCQLCLVILSHIIRWLDKKNNSIPIFSRKHRMFAVQMHSTWGARSWRWCCDAPQRTTHQCRNIVIRQLFGQLANKCEPLISLLLGLRSKCEFGL